MADIQERAALARSHFEQIKRGDDTIWTRKDDSPQWVQDMTYAAHGDFLPDDWRYEFIVDALYIIEETEDEDRYAERIDSATDVYTSELGRWLASSVLRMGYVDQAVEDYGHGDGISRDIAIGQYAEREEVLYLVRDFLAELDEDDVSEVTPS